MAGYVLVKLEVTDPIGFEAYRSVVRSTFEQFGGEHVVRGGEPRQLEGEGDPRRLVVIKFPSAERARAWWSSDLYREPKEVRLRTARTDLIIAEGVPDEPEHSSERAGGYVIAQVEVTDPAGFELYRGMVPATIEQYGGRYAIRGGQVEILEGSWDPKRLVMLQFPSADRAQAWWESGEYAEAKALRQRTARTNLMVVEAV
jgi:uncharacterized protein (DUF1330 family)